MNLPNCQERFILRNYRSKTRPNRNSNTWSRTDEGIGDSLTVDVDVDASEVFSTEEVTLPAKEPSFDVTVV